MASKQPECELNFGRSKLRNKCLIAGGAGFVGSNLARQLLAQGAVVDCVDNLSTGRLSNLNDLIAHRDFRFIELDVTDEEGCRTLLNRRYTRVYNLACPTGVPNIAIMGEEMLAVCSAGTLNLLKVARRSKAKYLFASTAEAYGDPEIFPQPETYVGHVDPVGPRSPYEEGKRFGEALTRFYGSKYGVEVYTVRIFNTYGPAMSPDDQRVIPQMLSRMIKGEPVQIFGTGSQTRTFLHVDDLIRGFETVLERGQVGEIYNIGGSQQLTIEQLYSLVRKVTGLEGEVVHLAHFIQDHKGRCPDTSKVRALGWRQQITMEDGIRQSHQDILASLAAARPSRRRTIVAPALNELMLTAMPVAQPSR